MKPTAITTIPSHIGALQNLCEQSRPSRVDASLEAVERNAGFPSSGRAVPETEREDIREIILEDYRIVYQLRDGGIVVLTVFEGHMLLPVFRARPKGDRGK